MVLRFGPFVLMGLVFVTTHACLAQTQFFVGSLDGLQENPPVATPGVGVGYTKYNNATQELTVSLIYSGLVAGATNAHIHCCATALDQNAGVAIHFVPAGFVLGNTSGNFNATFDLSMESTYDAAYFAASGGTVAQARDRLLNAMRFGVANDPLPGDSSIAYYNIHTTFRTGGEIRGNIVPHVPEPASLVLLAAMLVPVASLRRTRSSG